MPYGDMIGLYVGSDAQCVNTQEDSTVFLCSIL